MTFDEFFSLTSLNMLKVLCETFWDYYEDIYQYHSEKCNADFLEDLKNWCNVTLDEHSIFDGVYLREFDDERFILWVVGWATDRDWGLTCTHPRYRQATYRFNVFDFLQGLKDGSIKECTKEDIERMTNEHMIRDIIE